MSNFTFQYNPQLDGAFLKSIYDDDLETAIISFEQFLKLHPQQIGEIEESFKEGNIDSFRMKIHKAKPTFSYVGLTAISAKAEAVEQLCLTANSVQELNKVYGEFKTCLQQLLPVVQHELIRMKT